MGIDSTHNIERLVLEDLDLDSARQTVREHATNEIDELELLDELGIGGNMVVLKNERKTLKRANPDKQWANKVDHMSASQVIDVLSRLRKQRKI
jgi:hypothetical protein